MVPLLLSQTIDIVAQRVDCPAGNFEHLTVLYHLRSAFDIFKLFPNALQYFVLVSLAKFLVSGDYIPYFVRNARLDDLIQLIGLTNIGDYLVIPDGLEQGHHDTRNRCRQHAYYYDNMGGANLFLNTRAAEERKKPGRNGYEEAHLNNPGLLLLQDRHLR
jgi:hypothetical protein